MSTPALQQVPLSAFVILAALIALGILQSFPRRVSVRRTVLLPAAFLSLSLFGVMSSFGTLPEALLAWVAGVAAALVALHGRVDVSSVRYEPRERRFIVPGSWAPLALMMGLFAVKFVVGASLARQPALATVPTFAIAASAAYGLFSGAFLGRALALWSLIRRSGELLAATRRPPSAISSVG
ncbi:MAG: DUF6622 family protein [Gemmatimonadota bacterium]